MKKLKVLGITLLVLAAVLLVFGGCYNPMEGASSDRGDDLSVMAKKIATSSFVATFPLTVGDFWIAGDVGKSVLFIVEESGDGNEQTFGDFAYEASLLHNLARKPPGSSDPNSSTAVGGSAVLTFADGQIRLKRISGTAIFLFPTITVEEQWVIASGTGNYVGATGKLSRQFVGDVRFGTVADGTLEGTIEFHN